MRLCRTRPLRAGAVLVGQAHLSALVEAAKRRVAQRERERAEGGSDVDVDAAGTRSFPTVVDEHSVPRDHPDGRVWNGRVLPLDNPMVPMPSRVAPSASLVRMPHTSSRPLAQGCHAAPSQKIGAAAVRRRSLPVIRHSAPEGDRRSLTVADGLTAPGALLRRQLAEYAGRWEQDGTRTAKARRRAGG